MDHVCHAQAWGILYIDIYIYRKREREGERESEGGREGERERGGGREGGREKEGRKGKGRVGSVYSLEMVYFQVYGAFISENPQYHPPF